MYKAKTLKQILYLLFIGILFGILKVEFFITFIDSELTERTRIISYITLGLSSIFFYFVIILAVLSSYFTIDMLKLGSHFKINNFYKSINYFIWALMINELWKFLLTIFTFKSMSNISTEEEFNSVLSDNSLWVELISLSDLLFISLGAVAYIIMLRKNEKNVNYLEVIISTIPLFLSFVIFKIF
ncbi:hypothetical protein [Mesoflavibacter sp. CH_XMU1422-2]|uniref:hypothetical protein n=1 Tax=Mesoflavibacter sp. CH_XMU1422-2 TaxID=3107770 RepID=UPI003008F95D